MSSDSIYLNGLHMLTLTEIPVHTFGAFIIVAKTPKKMSSIRWTMLLLHFVGAFLDVYLSFFASPVLTLPMCSGYPLGISVALGVPTPLVVYLGISFVGVIAVTILGFFEDRYHRLIYGRMSNGERDWKRKLYIASHYVLAFLFIAPAYLTIPDQQIAKYETKQKVPCIASEVLDRPGYFILATETLIACLCLIFMALVVTSQAIFYVASMSRFLFLTVSKTQSSNTLRLQKQFFVALCLQVVIPIFVLFVPVFYIIIVIWFNIHNQGWTNIAVLVMATHGIASTFTMLFVHKPYRDATLTIFCPRSKSCTSDQSQLWKTRGTTVQSQVF
uniref:Serpentine Receptor, class H n=1 Tax=Caenorhabditis japonica TaxID=281687 RepID=A0A8R1DUR7_CAEJA